MRIGGLQKLSLVDFPERTAAVVFTTGCVFQCGFCYNKNLVRPPFAPRISEEELFAFLENRRGKLDGVVITGGEPTLHADLLPFLRKIHARGFAVKLDSNGYFPDRLRDILSSGIIAYIAMDIKAPAAAYAELAHVADAAPRITQSIEIIRISGIPYEFRSTLIDGIHTLEWVEKMARMIRGARAYYLQSFQPTETLLDPAYREKTAPSSAFLEEAAARCRKYVEKCEIR